MARKSSAKPAKGPASAKTGRSGMAGRIISAAFDLAVEDGWRGASLTGIAAKAGLTLAQVYSKFTSKTAIINGFMKNIDEKVLGAGPADAEDSPRDRLFDVLMRRFDALNPHKEALRAILRGSSPSPSGAVCAGLGFMRSMAWMLEAAGLPATGPRKAVMVNGLALIYLNALKAWLCDDTSDMAKTMAALDKGLAKAETLVRMCSRPRCRDDDLGEEAAGA